MSSAVDMPRPGSGSGSPWLTRSWSWFGIRWKAWREHRFRSWSCPTRLASSLSTFSCWSGFAGYCCDVQNRSSPRDLRSLPSDQPATLADMSPRAPLRLSSAAECVRFEPDSKHPPSSSSAPGPDKRGADHRPYTSRPVQNTGVLQHAELTLLEESLDHIRAAPADGGTVELIVRRPGVDEREVLTEARLDIHVGLEGDTWRVRGSTRTPDGGPNPDAQLTLMNSRAAAAMAGNRDRWADAGDQLYVDLDISRANLPPGSRVQIGSAVIEFSEPPHTGCAKFSARFGVNALKFVNSPIGRDLRLRGANCRVVVSGTVRAGDAIRKLPQ